MKKRFTMQMLQALDMVRELEMAVDSAVSSPGYGIQFWQDVRLYGVDEAILYMRNGRHGDADKLQTEWVRIRGNA